MMIPIDRDLAKLPDTIKLVDKVLLTGGEDVAPLFYGQDPHPLATYQSWTWSIWDRGYPWSHQARKSLAGCLPWPWLTAWRLGNAHRMSVSIGILTLRPWSTNKRQLKSQFTSHFVTLSQPRLNFLPETYHVNSYHHQMIDRLADDLTTIATASDGVIEAVENKAKHVTGVMASRRDWDTISDERAFLIFCQSL